MAFRGIEINSEEEKEVPAAQKPEQVNQSGSGSESNRETGSGLARLGRKLKSWYIKNGNLTYIPDIHLMIDDDRP